MNRKVRLIVFCVILFPIFLSLVGCYERIDYTDEDFVQKDLLAAKGNISPNNLFNGVLCDGWVYYSNYNDNQKIYKIKLDGTNKTKLNNHVSCEIIGVQDGWIYYNDESSGYYIYKMKIDGKNKTEIIGGQSNASATGFKIQDDWIYYDNWADMYCIYRVKKDGTKATKLCKDTYGNHTVEKDWIYFVDYFNRNLYRMKLDGTNKSVLFGSNTLNFKIVDNNIYCLSSSYDGGDGKLYKINLDGTNKVKIINEQIEDFDICDKWIYYRNKNGINKMNLNGSDNTLMSNLPSIGSFWVTGEWYYFRAESEHEHWIARQILQ